VGFPVGFSSLCLLTMWSLSQAPRLGGLHRASRVPFRGSYFTSGLHPSDATPQRLNACLVQALEISSHSIATLRGALRPPTTSRTPVEGVDGSWLGTESRSADALVCASRMPHRHGVYRHTGFAETHGGQISTPDHALSPVRVLLRGSPTPGGGPQLALRRLCSVRASRKR
jgi:hypothetical protein